MQFEYLDSSGKVVGPGDRGWLASLCQEGVVTPGTKIRSGGGVWTTPAPELFSAAQLAAWEDASQPRTPQIAGPPALSGLLAAIAGLFTFGAVKNLLHFAFLLAVQGNQDSWFGGKPAPAPLIATLEQRLPLIAGVVGCLAIAQVVVAIRFVRRRRGAFGELVFVALAAPLVSYVVVLLVPAPLRFGFQWYTPAAYLAVWAIVLAFVGTRQRTLIRDTFVH